ncbi:MAG: GGDEF domain-containing protein [Gammaproteobacteria bacterium]|nr:GGDEF domain-containing protein [Gammaproteobacteria bacterium]
MADMKDCSENMRQHRTALVARVLVRVGLIVSLVELLIMLTFSVANWQLSTNVEALVDSLALPILSSPLIYCWVVRPFMLQRDRAIEQVQHMAYHDELTGLGNRRYLQDALHRAVAGFSRYHTYHAVIMLDMDGFKQINDFHGHEVGDAVLREVARRLKAVTRVEDEICRLGGDEFVIVIRAGQETADKAYDKVAVVARKLLQIIEQPFSIGDVTLTLGASIGVRLIDGSEANVQALLKDVDRAMYTAKQRGKGQVAYFELDIESSLDGKVALMRLRA